MFFRQYYLGCLSHASYMVGDEETGRAVVVDPQRDVTQYLEDAAAHHLTIERVIETHFHADFVSGHLELAAETGASIWYGPGADAEYPIGTLADGDRIPLGNVALEVLHTPGHTPESISVVVREREGDPEPYGVLTGDALFIGDVGRPDLLAAGGRSAENMARQLYRSLHDKLMALPDATRVYPAHGAGSACGRNLSTETVSTIGEQRRTNYALAPTSEDEFVAAVTDDQPIVPAYFSFSAHRNRERHDLLGDAEPPSWLNLVQVLSLQAGGGVVVDTRDPAEFAQGHLLGAVNVGLGGRFAEYAGDVIRPDQQVAVVCDPGRELEARVRLARIGFDRLEGALREPLLAFQQRPDLVVASSRLTAGELQHRRQEIDLVLVDVRNPREVEASGTIPGAAAIPLARLMEQVDTLDPRRPTVMYCAGGYRSSIAASYLASQGFTDVSDLVGGWDAWTALVAA